MALSASDPPMSPSLSTYKALSFDIFGTLLDWERGIYPFLQPLVAQLAPDHPFAAPFPTPPPEDDPAGLPPKHPLFQAFDAHELKLEAELPRLKHETVLGYAYRDLAAQLGVEARAPDVESIQGCYAHLPAFADTKEALRRLGPRVKLVGLSNVSEDGIRNVLAGPLKDVKFDAIYTAEAIGSYKPALENFEYLLDGVRESFGVEKAELLHVAHGIQSDQITPERIGLDHVWVERGTDNGKEILEGMKRLRIVKDMKQLADEFDTAAA